MADDGSGDPGPAPGSITSHVPLLLVILVAVSTWIYIFTNWYPLFGSVLGLGGVLVVVPALSGLMSEDRRKAYSGLVDRILFQKPLMAKFYLLALVVGLTLGFAALQPLRITNESRTSPVDAVLTITGSDGQSLGKRIRIEPGGTFAASLKQPLLGGTVQFELAAQGLPSIQHNVDNFSWPAISVPTDLWQQPVLLLRAEPALLSALRSFMPRLEVEVVGADGNTRSCIIHERYLGEPVWLGGGKGKLAVSDTTIQRWLLEFRMALARDSEIKANEMIMTSTLRPDCIMRLAAADSVSWKIVSRGSGRLISAGKTEIALSDTYPKEIHMRLEKGE